MPEEIPSAYQGISFPTDHDLHEPCAMCGRTPTRVQEYMVVMSFLLITRRRRWYSLLCRSCATRSGLTQLAKSAVLGWWGIPWGLMTFQALWVNTCSLVRWSTLAPVIVLSLMLAGMSPPALLLYWYAERASTEKEARATGDWVTKEVSDLIDRGHARQETGDFEGALLLYRRAHEQAPNSSVVNHSLAVTYLSLGDPESARPFAERCAVLSPSSVSCATVEANVLFALGGRERAKDALDRVREMQPKSTMEALDLAGLYATCRMQEERLGALDAGLAQDSKSEKLQMQRFLTLLELDRVAEAADQLEALRSQVHGAVSYVTVYGDIYGMRADPEGSIDAVFRHWVDLGYNGQVMEMIAMSAARSGSIESVRDRVSRWLNAEDTPSEAWTAATPWFDEERWVRELDQYLARRPEVVPGLMRLSLYDPVEEREPMLELVTRIRDAEHPLAQYVDLYYYGARSTDPTRTDADEEHVRHAEDRPDHELCALMACSRIARTQADRAANLLDKVAAATDVELFNPGNVDLIRAEIDLGRGNPLQALERLNGVELEYLEPPLTLPQACLLGIETAFHADDSDALRIWQDRLEGLPDSADLAMGRAAALLVRWSDQVAAGKDPTFTADVHHWLVHDGEKATSRRSASALGLLLVEGRVERPWVERRIPASNLATLDLVAWFQCRAEGRRPERSLESIAGDGTSREFAPMLAQHILDRQARAEGRLH